MKKIIAILALSVTMMGCGESNKLIEKPIKSQITMEEINTSVINILEDKQNREYIIKKFATYNEETKERNTVYLELMKEANQIPIGIAKGIAENVKAVKLGGNEYLDGKYIDPFSRGVIEFEKGKFVSRTIYDREETIPFFKNKTYDFSKEFVFVKPCLDTKFAFFVSLYYSKDAFDENKFNGSFIHIEALELLADENSKNIGKIKDKQELLKLKKEVFTTLNIEKDFEYMSLYTDIINLETECYDDAISLVYYYNRENKTEEILRKEQTYYKYLD